MDDTPTGEPGALAETGDEAAAPESSRRSPVLDVAFVVFSILVPLLSVWVPAAPVAALVAGDDSILAFVPRALLAVSVVPALLLLGVILFLLRSMYGARVALLFIVAFVIVPFLLLPAALIAILVGAFIPSVGESSEALRALVNTLILQSAMLALAALIVRAIYRQPFLKVVGWSRDFAIPGRRLVLWGLGLAVAVMIVSVLFPPSSPPIEQLLNTPQAVAMFAFFGIGIAPFLEEVIFRGFYFRLVEDMRGPEFAVGYATAIFTLLHVPQLWGSWPAIGVILVVGYVLSRVRRQTGSLIPSFVMHTAYNSTLFLATAIGMMAGVE
jgi:membrane protease YdiL (CAAX protease family)